MIEDINTTLIGDIERAVASVLYKQVIEGGDWFTPTQIGEKMRPNLGWVRVDHAIKILEHYDYLQSMRQILPLDSIDRVYRLSPIGIQWFESLHKTRRRLIYSSYIEQQNID